MKKIIQIKEYEQTDQPLLFSAYERNLILKRCKTKLNIIRPLEGEGYLISASSYVGVFNVDHFQIRVEPKVPLVNVFQMLCYAYELAFFDKEQTEYNSIQELFEYLIQIFQKKILRLAKEGLFSNYLQQHESLKFLRGKIDIPLQLRKLWKKETLPCEFCEYSPDILENQIIISTLDKLLTMHYTNPEIRQNLEITKRYYSEINLKRLTLNDFLNVQYHVLNQHYKPIHQFCRMIYELIGIHENQGDIHFNAYSVDMNILFERYIGRLLKENLKDFQVDLQKGFYLDEEMELRGKPDIIIYDADLPVLVLDTKYKIDDKVNMQDIHQMNHYMNRLGVNGVLLYPAYQLMEKFYSFGSRKLYIKTFRLDELEKGEAELLDWVGAILNL